MFPSPEEAGSWTFRSSQLQTNFKHEQYFQNCWASSPCSSVAVWQLQWVSVCVPRWPFHRSCFTALSRQCIQFQWQETTYCIRRMEHLGCLHKVCHKYCWNVVQRFRQDSRMVVFISQVDDVIVISAAINLHLYPAHPVLSSRGGQTATRSLSTQKTRVQLQVRALGRDYNFQVGRQRTE